MSAQLLAMRGIEKSFPGVRALKGIDLEANRGQILALVGENGAGKSTLMHILAGVYRPDAGTIEIDGQPQVIHNEAEAQRLGIAIVYQERSLFSQLSVAENIFVNRQPKGRLGLIDSRKLYADARIALDMVGLRVDPRTPLDQLSHAEQQMVEIAKALSLDARILIFDEPTAALTPAETKVLFGLIRKLQQKGTAVIYISHRLQEVFELADRVMILRDGTHQGTFPRGAITPGEIVSRMVGREIEPVPIEENPSGDQPVLVIRQLTTPKLAAIDLTVERGEITGIFGLEGCGRTELARALFGVEPWRSGHVLVNGREVHLKSPKDAINAGIGYATEDRKEQGLFLEMDVTANIAAANLDRFGWWLDEGAQITTAQEFRDKLRIASSGVKQTVRTLSGGNQQKVILARWLLLNPSVLIVDEPTRGIDIKGKADVHELLRALARDGKAVLLMSSDLPEVLALSHRIVVMRQGRITGTVDYRSATEERIMSYASLGSEEQSWQVRQ